MFPLKFPNYIAWIRGEQSQQRREGTSPCAKATTAGSRQHQLLDLHWPGKQGLLGYRLTRNTMETGGWFCPSWISFVFHLPTSLFPPTHSNQDHKTLVLSLPTVSILGKNGTQTGCAIICLESHHLEYRIQIQSPYFLISFTACNNLRLTVRYILAKLLMMDRCIMSEAPMPIRHQLAMTRKG